MSASGLTWLDGARRRLVGLDPLLVDCALAAAQGGELEAGPRPEAGLAVSALLPLDSG